jgi:hypothetical protein
VTLVINGTRTDLTINHLPVMAYLSLGQYTAASTETSTVDDLRMSRLGRLTRYGYFDVDDTTDKVDHSWEVSGYTNGNQYLNGPEYGYLDYCRPHSCVVLAQWQQFIGSGNAWTPQPNSAQLLTSLRDAIGGNLDKVLAMYMVDEPYDKGITGSQLQAAADQLHSFFPGQQIMLTLSGPTVAAPYATIPSGVDWVGFDWYCQSSATLAATLRTLDGKLPTPYQQLVLFPESAPNICGSNDAGVAARQAVYTNIAATNPKVGYLMNFGWWLGTADTGAADNPLVDLPQTAAAQRGIGGAVTGTP